MDFMSFWSQKPDSIRDDGDARGVASPDEVYGMLNHFGHRVFVVGVLVSTPEDGINDVPSPGHLQRLETEGFFVGWLDAVGLGRVIVVLTVVSRPRMMTDGLLLLNLQRRS
jgi:hypothetical protein